jgi:cytochrome c oxidase subunit 4
VIFGALMVGTLLTVVAAKNDLDFIFPGANTVVALTIAVIKATLVVLYFMHVRYSTRLIWVIVVAGFFWLGIMFVFTLSDYLTRPSGLTAPG